MNDHMKEARGLAAQCWCDEKNSSKEMDGDLAESFARRIATWIETAVQGHRNADYYRGLLDECAKHLGKEAYTADDGTIMDDPLRTKIPELVAAAKEDADYAWRNVRILEAARVEEMRKRDEAARPLE